MAWEKRIVTDQNVEFPNRFKIDGVSKTIEPDFGTVVDAGTPINKAYLQPIEDFLEELDDRQGTHEAKDATTSQKGHVQLIDSVSSTSTTTAATPKNVKQAYDLANLALPKDGGTMTGGINMADKLLTRPEIKDYAETVGTTPATTGSVTFNLTTGNVFNLTPTGNVTIGFSNWPASGKSGSVTVRLKNGATVYSKTFAAAIKWVNDEIPDLSEANKAYDLVFSTTNAGTVIHGAAVGPYSA